MDEAISSPVAVYDARGEAWIIQGDEGGNLRARMAQEQVDDAEAAIARGADHLYFDLLVHGKRNYTIFPTRWNALSATVIGIARWRSRRAGAS